MLPPLCFAFGIGGKMRRKGNRMKKIIEEISISEKELALVRRLAEGAGISEITAKILYSRGIDTPEKAARFLHPSRKNFLSPFLMRGMRELVDAISAAKLHGGTVAVFGDYDADGIGAASILVSALRQYGVGCTVYIPERSEGYGMSVSALEKIIDECAPELIVTVDCGISNREEVEYVKSRGVSIIVTDHHELPDELPACTVVNPKLSDDYPYDNLCGAGVAFKVACALLGEKAYSFLDIAAVSTVADSVPLTGENRDIVFEGLRRINTRPREAIRHLLCSKKEEATAQTLAFTIAPRINAAGRMGSASTALKLFLSEDPAEIYELSCKLNEYNIERQQVCDEVYRSAKEKIAAEGAYGSVIVLSDDSWSTGLVGIAAARLAEEFCRPTILFARKGSCLKGSARTVEGINIYDAIKACSGFVTEFGGHAQAAGVSVAEEQFEAFKNALDRYVSETYPAEAFIPCLNVCGKDVSVDLPLARELELLEPCGVGNRKPLFSASISGVEARRLKEGSPHIAFGAGDLELIWFGGERALPLLAADVRKTVVFECGVSRFRGAESVRGVVRDVVCESAEGDNADLYFFRNELLRLRCESPAVFPVYEDEQSIRSRISAARSACGYGLILLSSSKIPPSFRDCAAGLPVEMFRLGSQNVGNAVLISPAPDADLSMYRDVIWLDRPADFNIKSLEGKKIVVNQEICGYNTIAGLETSREVMGEIYLAFRGGSAGSDSVSAALQANAACSKPQAVFALEVFAELGLVRFERGRVNIARGKKTDLNASALYRAVCALKDKT